ncbi:hypothetical protein MLD38_011579 [Melastoma candidum]|uniref:Uncharacterized protein n=1 Tax=Melastoma candidum TaxID=119954 RepID=A0ACB9R3L2_9MYRT|nr:hypothetical protein MLD38_011579 [Melastoma candidum]
MESCDQYQQVPTPKYECLLFDLDDTLYPLSSSIAAHITKNIQEYMRTKLQIEESKVPELCLSLYRNYGTTMAGLRAIGYDFDYDDFHGFVHGRLPYDLLKPDHVLRQLLRGLPMRKLIFTNADKAHASRVLHRLGLEDCFDGIICFETLNTANRPSASENVPKTPVVCKPFEEAYKQVFKLAGINPQKTVFFDDSIRNLQTGKQMGLHTVLVGNSHRTNGADHALESIHNMREALPELWEADEKPEGIDYAGKVAVEMPVKA